MAATDAKPYKVEDFQRDRSLDHLNLPAQGLTDHEKYLFDLRGYVRWTTVLMTIFVWGLTLTPAAAAAAAARAADRGEGRADARAGRGRPRSPEAPPRPAPRARRWEDKLPHHISNLQTCSDSQSLRACTCFSAAKADASASASHHKETHLGSDRTGIPEGDGSWGAASLVEWGGVFVDIIDLPTIAPKLRALFGDAPYRMDHDYANVHGVLGKEGRAGPGALYLHGGGQGAGGPSDLVGPTDGGQCYYRYNNGKFFNGLIGKNEEFCIKTRSFYLFIENEELCIKTRNCVLKMMNFAAVAFEFEDIMAGDGGFACVPGSHKANVELPSDWKVAPFALKSMNFV